MVCFYCLMSHAPIAVFPTAISEIVLDPAVGALSAHERSQEANQHRRRTTQSWCAADPKSFPVAELTNIPSGRKSYLVSKLHSLSAKPHEKFPIHYRTNHLRGGPRPNR